MSARAELKGPRLLGGGEGVLAGVLVLLALLVMAADGAGALLCGWPVAPKAAVSLLVPAPPGVLPLSLPWGGADGRRVRWGVGGRCPPATGSPP